MALAARLYTAVDAPVNVASVAAHLPRGVFLSYRRDDTRHLAGRVYDRLVERFGNVRVFMDVDSIEPGLDFASAIDSAVASCGVMLVLIGRRWLSAHDEHGRFVVLEIAAALQEGVRVLPVLVDGAPSPRVSDLPELLQPLARRQAIRLDHDTFRSDVEALLTAVDRVLEAPKSCPSRSSDPLPSAGRTQPVGSRAERLADHDGLQVPQSASTSVRWVPLGTTALVATTILVVILALVVYLSGGAGSDGGFRPPSASTPGPLTSAGAATPVPSAAAPQPATFPADVDPVAFVRDYYALLPGNTGAAWAMLGEEARALSGGFDAYYRFYAGLRSVTVVEALEVLTRSDDVKTVAATLVFERKNGISDRFGFLFVIGTENDRTVIKSYRSG